jgi:hypothetical protein
MTPDPERVLVTVLTPLFSPYTNLDPFAEAVDDMRHDHDPASLVSKRWNRTIMSSKTV